MNNQNNNRPESYGDADKCANAIIESWWPGHQWHAQKSRDEDFLVVMRKMQRDLLAYREQYMREQDNHRARKTIAYLDALDRGEKEAFW